jgi:hypothetical protein
LEIRKWIKLSVVVWITITDHTRKGSGKDKRSQCSGCTSRLIIVLHLNKRVNGVGRGNGGGTTTFVVASEGGTSYSSLNNAKRNQYKNISKLPSSIEGIIKGKFIIRTFRA